MKLEGKPESLKEKVERLEREGKWKKYLDDADKKTDEVKLNRKWTGPLKKSIGKGGEDKVVMIYLNIKGELENPKLVPLYSGNVIIYKHKAYEFDPRATWTMKLKKNIVKVVLIREIDRRPISNLDYDEIRKRGDSTDSDEILIKTVAKAVIEKAKTQMNKGIIIMVVLGLLAAAAVYFFIGK